MKISQHPSPNFGERRGGANPDIVVLHYTAMVSTRVALERLCDPTHEVSAHYLISNDGDVFQLVNEKQRAWHAGAGAWGGCTDVNSRSLGIELANDGQSPFAARQMNALESLLGDIVGRWNIRPERIIAHSDMAPSRKGDPGRKFDWRRLAATGLAVWPDADATAAKDVGTFRADAIAFGYPDSDTDAQLLDAFRQRFRPWAFGDLDTTDAGLIGNLAARFPVDLHPVST